MTDGDRLDERRLLGALMLAFLVFRLPFILHGYDVNDEGVYWIATGRWLDGGRLYIDALERRPPLLFLAYAAVFKVGGRTNMHALHIAATLWVMATMVGMRAAARWVFGARAGLAAAALYGLYSAWGDYANLAWNGEVLLNMPLAWGVALAVRPSRSRARPELLAAGALIAGAFLFKQPAAAAAVALGVYLLLPSYRRQRGLSVLDSLVQAAVFTLGFAIPIAVTAWWLYATGILDQALLWVYRHHDMPYGPLTTIFWERLEVAGVWFAVACLPLIPSAGAALQRRSRWVDWDGKQAERLALLLLLVTAGLGVSASGRFYLHYFDLLIPALALAASPVVARLLSGDAPVGPSAWPLRPVAMRRLLAGTVAVFFLMHAVGLATRTKGSEAGRYIKEHAGPTDQLFVWGELPRIYLYAERRPATRYISTYALTGYPYGGSISYDPPLGDTTSRIVPGSWDIFQREIEASKPRYIVDAETTLKIPRYPMTRFPWLADYVARSYRKVHEARDGVVYERNRNVD
jgi:4-amino-4-deoxy-L-arabinose transferase-like glycosyltransferase